ncbi:MAG: OmpH family outer membrane protein [Deltaproteobacteria bacterium]|nr:OmpH family outer membrane protein [Deltaproteobacteria bacterium]
MPKFKATSFLVAIFVAAFALCTVQGAQAQDSQIAVFYLQKVFENSKKGKDAAKKLDAKYESLKKSLDTKAKDIQKKGQELESARGTLSEDAYVKRRDDLAKEYSSLMEQDQTASADFAKAREEAMLPLMKKVTDVVGNIAKERGYQFVFEVQNAGVFYHPSAADITDEVIKNFDK